MLDQLVLLRDGAAAGSLTATANGSAVNMGPFQDMTFQAVVPSAAGTSPTLDITIQHSANGTSGWTTFYTFDQITAAGVYYGQVSNDGDKPYVRAVSTVGGTSPVFGNVTIAPAVGGEFDQF